MKSFEITSGADHTQGIKMVISGTEGIGKTTLASQLPDPLFMDMEGGTAHFDNIRRLPVPKEWKELNEMIEWVGVEKPCSTLVIDTFDWAEMLEVEDLLKTYKEKSIESFGYGKGYVLSTERIAAFLKSLQSRLIAKGINVVLTCHTQVKKFEAPEEAGSYDRYELKLGAKTGSRTAALVKEWCDIMLFCNYQTTVERIKDGQNTKLKASGGKERVMYTTHSATWDAKNRFGLPDELPMEYKSISHIFEKRKSSQNIVQKPKSEKQQPDRNADKSTCDAKQTDTDTQKAQPIQSDAPNTDIPLLIPLPESLPEDVKTLCHEQGIYTEDIQQMLFDKNIVKRLGYELEKVPAKFWKSFVKDFDEKWAPAIEEAKNELLPF